MPSPNLDPDSLFPFEVSHRYRDMSERDLLISIATKMERMQEDNADHENRIRGLETIRNYAVAGYALLSGAVVAHFRGWLGKA